MFMKLYRTGEVAEKFGVSTMTIRRWIKAGIIQAIKIGKEYRIPETEVLRLLKGKEAEKVVIYARVSTEEEKDELDKQVEHLKNYCTARGYHVVKVITDISSALDEDREGLKELFKLVESGEITKVVITSKDRLTRFGFRYLEQYFKSHGVEIEAIFDKEDKASIKEFVRDYLTITQAFANAVYGKHPQKKKHLIETIKNALKEGKNF